MGIAETCNGSTTCDIVLRYVVPSLGSMSAVALTVSPLPAVRACVSSKSTGPLNTLPFAAMTANALAWTIYSFFIHDYFLLFPNTFTFAFGLYYSLVLLPFDNEKAQRQTVACLIGVQVFALLSMGIVFISQPAYETGTVVMGVLGNVILVGFYGSPLSVCISVVKTRDPSSLNVPLLITTAVNCILWFAYGIALSNYFIAVPQVLGLFFVIIQAILILLYRQSGRRRGQNAGGISTSSSTESLAIVDTAATTANVNDGGDESKMELGFLSSTKLE
ncbi:sugar efflux transporter for intercellular exchange-domain-containing protein [Obelidium mucronatum]|nr:sugar efflux transporter for intercellular exchange-domain-containing protein [Obelidium mucronatum]